MASITPYPGGRYRAVVRRAGYKARSDIFPTRKAAEVWARSVEREIDARRYVDPGEAMRTTVAQLLDRYILEVAPTHKGERWEESRLRRLLEDAEFTRRRLDQLRPDDLRAWRDQRLTTVSPATVNRELNLISGVFSHAIKEWGIPLANNPVHMLKRPPASKPRRRRWSESEIKRLLDAAGFDESKDPTVGRDYVGWALLLAIETAMRLGELCALRVGDVDLEGRAAHLRDTKNGDSRTVPLSRRAGELLARLLAGKEEDDQVFPLCSESLGLYFREARSRAGLADIRFHDARHEAAIRLSKKLPNVIELSAVTGHRSLQSLKIYYHPDAADLAAKLD